MAQSWRSHSPAEHVLLLSLFPPLENRGSNSTYFMDMAFQMVLVIENMPANVGDIREAASIPGLGRFPGGGHGNPLIFLPGESHGQRSLAGYSP